MIEDQVQAIRNCMLRFLVSNTESETARYLAEVMVDQFVSINKGNPAFSGAVDIEDAAQVALPKYLYAGIQGGHEYMASLSLDYKKSLGKDYADLVEAYNELERIREMLCAN